ncbi:MAG: hypothetical protein V4617_08090 [Gemmatimonadota bacterium]
MQLERRETLQKLIHVADATGIAKVAGESSHVSFSQERGMLQLIGCDGVSVLDNLKVDAALARRIATELAAASE